MGTRADFYVGRGGKAEWLGSIAWDGHEIPNSIRLTKTEKAYRKNVKRFLARRDDGTFPKHGWPWPWNDSNLTDVVYAFDGARVYQADGYPDKHWWRADQSHPNNNDSEEKVLKLKKAKFPDMSSKKAVTLGERSGLIVI